MVRSRRARGDDCRSHAPRGSYARTRPTASHQDPHLGAGYRVSVEANTEAIIRLSWARALGLPDDAIAAPGSRAVLALPDEPGTDAAGGRLNILSLFDSTALVGAASMIERIGVSAHGQFELPRALSTLGPGARTVTHEVLSYRDEYSQPEPGDAAIAAGSPDEDRPLVSHDPADLAALLARCPVDDVNDADLGAPDTAFTMLDDDHRPLAAGVCRIRHGLLADVRALSAPEARGRGHAALLAELIVEDALDSGLIAQGRHHPASAGGARLAAALGFASSGSLIVLATGPTG